MQVNLSSLHENIANRKLRTTTYRGYGHNDSEDMAPNEHPIPQPFAFSPPIGRRYPENVHSDEKDQAPYVLGSGYGSCEGSCSGPSVY